MEVNAVDVMLCELVLERDYDAVMAEIDDQRRAEAEFKETEMLKMDALIAAAAQIKRTVGVRDLPQEDRRAYQAAAVRKHRAMLKDKKAEGNPEPTRDAVREALADAALMLLAVGGPGAEQVRAYLGKAFPGRPGVPMTVTSKARSGKLKPRSLNSRAI